MSPRAEDEPTEFNARRHFEDARRAARFRRVHQTHGRSGRQHAAGEECRRVIADLFGDEEAVANARLDYAAYQFGCDMEMPQMSDYSCLALKGPERGRLLGALAEDTIEMIMEIEGRYGPDEILTRMNPAVRLSPQDALTAMDRLSATGYEFDTPGIVQLLWRIGGDQNLYNRWVVGESTAHDLLAARRHE